MERSRVREWSREISIRRTRQSLSPDFRCLFEEIIAEALLLSLSLLLLFPADVQPGRNRRGSIVADGWMGMASHGRDGMQVGCSSSTWEEEKGTGFRLWTAWGERWWMCSFGTLRALSSGSSCDGRCGRGFG
ncbi:uncharacterized protein K489DRAFT_167023 [Dissoconium aciculare CBS 342.82]|uniref:Uncharacterized protein n=1 Tax=Dissoconium aciculare CBS 342.82 TaxID=1314786 RepID=A0A6J3MCI3_9PEZI|nr:uncharacterized protein K489DRAFT_167023 [Dissoconium aciculare CBS 342.82]KAF1825731.1 hypothetical protein K489DRAFT_167023 [Dissoconium aciculare CBS 342.82]